MVESGFFYHGKVILIEQFLKCLLTKRTEGRKGERENVVNYIFDLSAIERKLRDTYNIYPGT